MRIALLLGGHCAFFFFRDVSGCRCIYLEIASHFHLCRQVKAKSVDHETGKFEADCRIAGESFVSSLDIDTIMVLHRCIVRPHLALFVIHLACLTPIISVVGGSFQ